MNISFRQISKDDYNFVWQIHKDLFKSYVEQIWGWDEDWQRDYFDKNFSLENSEVIVVENKDIGFLRVEENPNFIFLRSILILPEYQNEGIGSNIISDLIETSTKPIELRVLKPNPARKLYERLGFQITEETETNFIMKFLRFNK